jgi:hypothetical protein
MRILLVTDQDFDDKYFTQFSKYALREDIVVVEYSSVKVEIEDRLLTKQEHFDLIIFDVCQSIDFDLNDNILTYIRTRTELSVYSAKNFKLNNIPIVFICKNYMDQRNGEISLSNFHYNIEYLTNENIPLYNTGMASAIDSWLSDLAADLDRLDLNTNFIFDKTNNQLNNERIYDCKILTNEFLTRKSNLDYNWVGNKLNLIEAGAEELYTLVKRHQNNPKLRNERLYTRH